MATAIKRSGSGTETGGKFKILIGEHLDYGPPGCECDACLKSNGTNHRYRARLPDDPPEFDGDIVECKQDLDIRLNYGTSRKVERVFEGYSASCSPAQSPPPSPFPLDKMTIAQLLAVAAEEEVDISKATDARGQPDKKKLVEALGLSQERCASLKNTSSIPTLVSSIAGSIKK